MPDTDCGPQKAPWGGALRRRASEGRGALARQRRAAAAPAEEASLVLTGLRLLRRDHDPTQASALLGRYLERFSQGALVQEGLALAIEASVAKGDGRGAAGLAEQYLARFPSGRFSRLTHRVDGTRP